MEEEIKAGEREQANNNENKRQILDLIQYKRSLLEEQKWRTEVEQVCQTCLLSYR